MSIDYQGTASQVDLMQLLKNMAIRVARQTFFVSQEA
jgi:hypothetical protein